MPYSHKERVSTVTSTLGVCPNPNSLLGKAQIVGFYEHLLRTNILQIICFWGEKKTCQILAHRSVKSLSQSLSSSPLLCLSAGLNKGSHIHLLHDAHFLIWTSLPELGVFPRDKAELLTQMKCSQGNTS